jgi:cysteinyl-tRNA synthetase
VLATAEDFITRFDQVMDDDFNTAAALGLTSDLLALANKLLDQPQGTPKDVRRRTLMAIRKAMKHVAQVMGVFTAVPDEFLQRRRTKLCQAKGILPEQVEQLIAQRVEARRNKDFVGADRLRQQLMDMGVEVMDGPSGTQWKIAE